jgi:ankyrin repeat protein
MDLQPAPAARSPRRAPAGRHFKIAATVGKRLVMGLLDKLRADPNEQLHDAVLAGNLAKVKKLLDAGADINHRELRDRSLRTPIQTALMGWGKTDSNSVRDSLTETIKLLLQRKADIGMPDTTGKTAKDWANQVGHFKAGVMISRVAAGKDPE